MKATPSILAVLFILSASPALAQGFAGLGTQSDGFAAPTPSFEFQFPADHGAHPAYRIEWWYLTAVLEGPDRPATARNGRCSVLRSSPVRETAGTRRSFGWDTPR